MVEESNQSHTQNESRFGQMRKSIKWKRMNLKELKKIIGLILLMGSVRKDPRNDYWSTDPSVKTPIFSKR
jgi:hypothetical protein